MYYFNLNRVDVVQSDLKVLRVTTVNEAIRAYTVNRAKMEDQVQQVIVVHLDPPVLRVKVYQCTCIHLIRQHRYLSMMSMKGKLAIQLMIAQTGLESG